MGKSLRSIDFEQGPNSSSLSEYGFKPGKNKLHWIAKLDSGNFSKYNYESSPMYPKEEQKSPSKKDLSMKILAGPPQSQTLSSHKSDSLKDEFGDFFKIRKDENEKSATQTEDKTPKNHDTAQFYDPSANHINKQLTLHNQSCSLDISQPQITIDEPDDFDLDEVKSIGTSTSEDADSYLNNLFGKV